MAVVKSSWATLRFRRSKDVKGWALLGIPRDLYPEVMQPLFERQTRFIEKHGRGEFVNVLFEAPVALGARLALAFPAPPSCEPLVVNQAGNRLLYGKFAQSGKARHQARESDAWPGLRLLNGDESFWQVVTTLSNVTTLPLERLHLPGVSIAAQTREKQEEIDDSGGDLPTAVEQGSAAKAALHRLVKGGLQLQPAAALTPQPKLVMAVGPEAGAELGDLDEDGFEEDDWEREPWDEAGEKAVEEEAFEDIWDTDESEDFWDNVPVKSVPSGRAVPQPSASASARYLTASASQSLSTTVQPRAATQSPLYRQAMPLGQSSRPPRHSQQHLVGRLDVAAVPSHKATPEKSGVGRNDVAVEPPSQVNLSEVTPPGNQALGRYRSGLVPHPSDASSLQVYNSGGLTIADAIARSHQQEEQDRAIAEQAQHRCIKLPFERSPTVCSRGNPSQPEHQQRPSWSYASHAPQLPEESWAAAAQSAVAPSEPAWKAQGIQASESWNDSQNWGVSQGLPPRQNPWLPPSQQQVWDADANAESSPHFAPVDSDGSRHGGGSAEAVDWGYYDEQGCWISCDPVMAAPGPVMPSMEINGVLVPAATDIVCMPVGEEEHSHILLQGVEVWNDWRLANPHIRPNLRGAYLNNLDLAGAELQAVDLRFALLFRADLRAADLSLALLVGADLIRADLGGASLWGASLGGAYLSHANLAGADLTQADLRDVYWQGAILTGAVMPDGQLFEEQY